MLTFLRKIRRSLVDSGSAGKYLIYALGEIALVVIGILIALQINNWNEQVKLKKLRQQYLINLLEELDDQVQYCSITINIGINKKSQIDHFFKVVNNPNSTPKEIKAASDSISMVIGDLSPPVNTFRDIVESGKINLFEYDIQNKIRKYFDVLELRFRVISQNMEHIKQFRNEWFSEIDLAYHQRKLDVEHKLSKDWYQDEGSLAFMKMTNFYSFRYDKANYLENRLNQIKRSAETLKAELEPLIMK